MNEYYVPARTFYRNKYNLEIRPASVYIQPYAEKQGNVIRLNIKESYIPRSLERISKITTKRSIITEWTDKSRKRLLDKLLQIDLNNQYLYVSLLTYSTRFKPFLTPELIKKHRNKFFIYLNRKYKNLGIVWKLEFTRKQMPHLHLLLTSPDKLNIIYLRYQIAKLWNQILCQDFNKVCPGIKNNYWKKIYNFHNNNDNTQEMKSKGIIHYYSSYMTRYKNKEYQNKLPYFLRTDKSFRFWGIVNGKNIKTYETEIIDLDLKQYFNLREKCILEIAKRNKFYYNNKYGLTYYLKSETGDIIDNDFVNLIFENSCNDKPSLHIQQSGFKLKHKRKNEFLYIPEKKKDKVLQDEILYLF